MIDSFRNKWSNAFRTGTIVLIVVFNLYWIYESLNVYWLYHTTTDILLFHPDWGLLVSAAMGFFGMVFALEVFEGRVKPLTGLLWNLLLFVFAAFFKVFSIMI